MVNLVRLRRFFSVSSMVFSSDSDFLVGLEGVELGDALDLDLGEADDVVLGDLALEEFLEGLQAVVDGLDDGFPGVALLDVAVDAVFDEDLLQRAEVPFFGEFAEFDLEFQLEQLAGLVGDAAEDVRDAEELRLAIGDDAGVGRDGQLAIGEGEERVARRFRIRSGGQVDEDVGVGGGVVLDLRRS